MGNAKKTDPHMCGGTEEGYYKKASSIIVSDDMVLFDVSSVLSEPRDTEDPRQKKTGYLAFFAVKAGDGTFVYKVTGSGTHPSKYDNCKIEWALTKEDAFPALAALTRELELSRDNGHYTFTHGLPQDFGGLIDVKYADGEQIKISSNQNPVISREAAFEIERLFDRLLRGEKADLPDPSDIVLIRFDEVKENGALTHAEISANSDGTCAIKRINRFSAQEVYESELTVSGEVLENIKKNAEKCGILAWSALPKYELPWKENKKLTFVFKDGKETAVYSDRILPEYVRGEFFAAEIELTTKG